MIPVHFALAFYILNIRANSLDRLGSLEQYL